MIVFHFPPFAQSSGSIRTLSFVRRLPDHNWFPVVLTACAQTYPEADLSSLAAIPPRAQIIRAAGLDVARHLSIAGRYPGWLATPDRWNTWAVAAFIAGLVCIRRRAPAVLWATFPISSALVAAIALHRATRIPLIVDLRDPIVYEDWPTNRWMRAAYCGIERRAVSLAAAVVVTTPSARRAYVERYPHVPPSRFRVIANGVDDTTNVSELSSPIIWNGPIVLVHSGLMEIPDRNPAAFFEAIAQMLSQGDVVDGTLRVVLRAIGRNEETYRRQIAVLGIGGVVLVEGRIPHSEALDEMRRASGLLLFQGAQCNRQIPAKAYEYLASRRPIIGLLDSAGDTYDLIANQWNVPYVGQMDSAVAIADVLRRFVADFRRQDVFVPAVSLIEKHSRAAGVGTLADLLDEVCGEASRFANA